jgi:hypothetical protein
MIALEGVATPEARCTAKPLPAAPARSTSLDFFLTASRWWAIVFLLLWLGHMYVQSNFFDMRRPRNPVTAKPLPAAPAQSTPLDF